MMPIYGGWRVPSSDMIAQAQSVVAFVHALIERMSRDTSLFKRHPLYTLSLGHNFPREVVFGK